MKTSRTFTKRLGDKICRQDPEGLVEGHQGVLGLALPAKHSPRFWGTVFCQRAKIPSFYFFKCCFKKKRRHANNQ